MIFVLITERERFPHFACVKCIIDFRSWKTKLCAAIEKHQFVKQVNCIILRLMQLGKHAMSTASSEADVRIWKSKGVSMCRVHYSTLTLLDCKGAARRSTASSEGSTREKIDANCEVHRWIERVRCVKCII